MNIIKAKIVSSEMVSSSFYLLTVSNESNRTLRLGKPGQFYEIMVFVKSFNLRIPISIFNIDKYYITFLIKLVGPKTTKLKSLKPNTMINIIGPLGNPFIVKHGCDYLFVSGGSGYAPLHFLHQYIPKDKVTWVHGGKSQDDVIFATKAIFQTTEDGTKGTKGLVTDEINRIIKHKKIQKIVACGSINMLKAIFEIAQKNKIEYDVSLEAYMACAVGVCYGCAVKIKDEKNNETYSRVCKEGPIYDGYKVVWENE